MASYTGTTWNIQTVDSIGDVGQYCSVALNSQGNPCISYATHNNGALKYAKWNGTSWDIETVDSQSGGHTSLAFDINGYPHISYWSNWTAKYAFLDASGWHLTTLETSMSGEFTSIAVDNHGYPHISYNGFSDNLKYAYWDGSIWHKEKVDAGRTTSIVLDRNNNPHIAYGVRNNNTAKYADWGGGNWSKQTLDNVGSNFSTSIALDNNDRPWICFIDGTEKLVCNHWDGSNWIKETVSEETVPSSISLAINNLGVAGISYVTENGLNYAFRGKSSEEADLVLTNLLFNPNPPVAGSPTTITIVITNKGNKNWSKRDLVIQILGVDHKGNPPGDSIWLILLGKDQQIRENYETRIHFQSDIQPGHSVNVDVEVTFTAADFIDEVIVQLEPAYEGQIVDDNNLGNRRTTGPEFQVLFNPDAVLNCFGELLTGLTHGIVNETDLCYPVMALRSFWENDFSQGKKAAEIYELFKEDRYREAGEESAQLVFDMTTNIVEQIKSDPSQCGGLPAGKLGKFSTVLSFFQAAFNEFKGQGCGAVLVHLILKSKEYNRDLFESINMNSYSTFGISTTGVIAASPVNLIVEKESGEINSVDIFGNETIEIDSSLAYKFGEIKCVLVSGSDTYKIKMEGTSTGVADLVVIQGLENGNYNTLTYEDVPITPTTKTYLEMSSTTTDYQMFIDSDGDGNPDITKEPDDIETIVELSPNTEILKNFELKQNYPNPFNPETKIEYVVPETGRVVLKIYNHLGQKVRTLVDQTKPAGKHIVVWDGKDANGIQLASGSYFYQLQIGDFTSVKKMIKLK